MPVAERRRCPVSAAASAPKTSRLSLSASLRLIEVGRNKESWSVPFKGNLLDSDSIEEAVIAAVRKKGALVSRGIDAEMTGPYGGIVLAGFRPVGRFEVAE